MHRHWAISAIAAPGGKRTLSGHARRTRDNISSRTRLDAATLPLPALWPPLPCPRARSMSCGQMQGTNKQEQERRGTRLLMALHRVATGDLPPPHSRDGFGGHISFASALVDAPGVMITQTVYPTKSFKSNILTNNAHGEMVPSMTREGLNR